MHCQNLYFIIFDYVIFALIIFVHICWSSSLYRHLLTFALKSENRMNRVDDTNSKDSKILKAFAQKRRHFRQCCYVGAAMVLVVMITENVSPTGYGRFGENTTIGVDPRLGWWLMELPCSVFFPWFFLRTARSHEFVPRLFACIFMMHYLYRGWIFPCLIRVHGKSTNFSLVPAIGGWMVTILHAYFNAKWFGEMGSKLNKRWLRSWKFILGALLYYSGLIATIYHDHIMRTLRDGDGPRFVILSFYLLCCSIYSTSFVGFIRY